MCWPWEFAPGRPVADGATCSTKEEQCATTVEARTYREGVSSSDVSPINVVGYGVEASDGSIGKVDDATYELGSSYIVVDTGPWIFGKKVMLPAGVIQSVDDDEEKIFVDRSKDEIKHAPEFDESMIADEQYRTNLGSYYGGPAH